MKTYTEFMEAITDPVAHLDTFVGRTIGRTNHTADAAMDRRKDSEHRSVKREADRAKKREEIASN